jgi:hypothetical protein
MKLYVWVKFRGAPPEEWKCEHFDDFWHRLREFMLRHPAQVEWLIFD